MPLSMYQASVPALERALTNLHAVLSKGEAHASARNIDPLVLTGSRLFPDMFALTRQVQIASDAAKGCAARLTGTDAPALEDTETSFPQLYARIEKTLAFIRSVKPEQFDGSEERRITIKTPRGELNFTGQTYLQFFVLPNLYFHCTTAYGILRHNGVEIGKFDFLGSA